MITGAHLERVLRSIPGAYGGQVASLDVLAAGANQALATAPAGLTQQGAAAFLATMSQESGSFRYLHEAGSASYLSSRRYAPYIGRTFEQLTWEANYRLFGYWCRDEGLVDDPNVFVKHPASLGDIRWAWLGGIFYWHPYGLWQHANAGDFLATQQAVNLGASKVGSSVKPKGYAARLAWYRAWLRVGSDLIPTASPNSPPNQEEPTTGRPIDMAAATDIYINYEGKQALVEGDNEIAISATSKTLVIGPNDGVDVVATIDVTDAAGAVVPVESFFRVVSYADKTPTTTISSRRPTSTDQVTFKGDISKDDAGRSPRLRLIVRVPGGVTDAVLNTVQITGWKL